MTQRKGKAKDVTAASTSKAGLPEEETETAWERTKANIKTIGGAVLLAILIRIVIFEAFEIEGPSMEPTLLNGDRVVVAKFRYGLYLPFQESASFTWGTPERGDVVIVNSPEDIAIVKRVIGLPGDTVEIRDDVVHVNGEPVAVTDLGECDDEYQQETASTCHWYRESFGDLSWRISRNRATRPANYPRTEVPEDHIYILGDHRDRSNDSRYFGPVHRSRVKGQALVIYWSSLGTWWRQGDSNADDDPGAGRAYPGRNEDRPYGVRWGRLFDAVE